MGLLQKVWWCFRGVLVMVNNLYCIPTYVVWCFLLQPLLLVAPQLFWTIEGLFFHWLLTMVAFWSHSASYRIVETGDSIDSIVDEETLVMVNHQSTSDVPLLMAAFASRPRLIPHLNWIMDAVFKFTNFGIVSILHGDFFINAGRDKREGSILELITFLKECYVPRRRKWLVLFPEGGFLRKRKETSNRYSRKLGLPELEHVTLPRMGAIQAIVDTIGPQQSFRNHLEGMPQPEKEEGKALKWIVDMTIAYPNGRPLDLVAIVTGCAPPCDIHFHYRVYPIHQVPAEKKELQNWMYARYLAKEEVLRKYYESGVWATEPVDQDPEVKGRFDGERIVEQDLLRIFILHGFFILSTLLHILIFRHFFC